MRFKKRKKSIKKRRRKRKKNRIRKKGKLKNKEKRRNQIRRKSKQKNAVQTVINKMFNEVRNPRLGCCHSILTYHFAEQFAEVFQRPLSPFTLPPFSFSLWFSFFLIPIPLLFDFSTCFYPFPFPYSPFISFSSPL